MEISKIDTTSNTGLMEPDSDEDDPAKLLSVWLGELDNLKTGLDGVNKRDKTNRAEETNGEYRCSLINLETSQSDELDAILGELTQLETRLVVYLL